jgi:uncharacterized protein YdeI (BOF family)
MKKTVIFVSLLIAAPWALAQAQAPKPEAKPAAQQQAAVKPVANKPVAAKSKRAQDARHCLSQANNTAIIKCAEAYL